MTMPTSIQLTPQQIAELTALRQQAETRGDAVGAWADFYGYLAQTIRNRAIDRGNAGVSTADNETNRPGDEAIWTQEAAGWGSLHSAARGQRLECFQQRDNIVVSNLFAQRYCGVGSIQSGRHA
jgi:hypothetical protein